MSTLNKNKFLNNLQLIASDIVQVGTFIVNQLHPRKRKENLLKKNQMTSLSLQVTAIFNKEGLLVAEQFIKQQNLEPKEQASLLIFLARTAFKINGPEVQRLISQATKLNPSLLNNVFFAFLLFDMGNILEADNILKTTSMIAKLPRAIRYKSRIIAGKARVLNSMIEIPPVTRIPRSKTTSSRLLYIASNSQPHHISGYTTRTHGMVKGLINAGWDVTCVTRPGYPFDRPDRRREAGRGRIQQFDGISYTSLKGPFRYKTAIDKYAYQAAKIIEETAQKIRPQLIQAASNYETGLPSLIAARNLGIPFVYEVRGLWEYTAASKIPGWEHTERFDLTRQLETLVASNADLVLTLTEALAEELISRGVDEKRIHIAPNAVDPKAFSPCEKDSELIEKLNLDNKFVIGYAGSLVGYEGLDDLISALNFIRYEVPHARLVIVGKGEVENALQDQVKALNLQNMVHFAGQIPSAEVKRYLSIFDVITLPRKPYKVCELVSPLKPFEAMAMRIPLIVSDIRALGEIIHNKKTGLLHRADDPQSLADSLIYSFQKRDLTVQWARNAYELVMENYTWNKVCGIITDVYTKDLSLINNYCVSYDKEGESQS